MKSGRMGLLAGAALVGLMAMGGSAVAQVAASGQTVATGDESLALTEIVVTANKRKERLQDVPVSVTAVTSGVLERQNVREVGDLAKLVPGLTISYGSQPANFSINMRGVGTFSNGIAVESDVAVVIDDVPYGFQAAAFTDLVDVERVEALRGPQSTLFGKSAIAGVLNITTQAPTETLTGKVTGLVTDDHEWRMGATVSGPISDTLLFRLTASASDYAGNFRNLNGGRLNGSGATTFSGKLLWRPTSNLEVSLAPHYSRSDSQCCVSALRSLVAGNGGELYYQKVPQLAYSTVLKGVAPSEFNQDVRMDYRAGGVSKLGGATIKTAYTFDDDSALSGATLQYIGSYNDWRMRDYQDVDGTASPVLMYYPLGAPLNQNRGAALNGRFGARSFTNELRLTSPGGQRVNYVAGLWYASNDLTRYLDRGPGIAAARFDSGSGNRTVAAFAQGDFKVTEALTVLGGLRLQDQRIDYQLTKFDVATNYTTSTTWARRDSESAVTGKVGAQYRVTPDFMAFATYSTGYKGQAYDLVSTFNSTIAANMPVPSEKAKNREIGFKSSLFDRRMILNVTAFQANYRGFQVSNTVIQPDGTFLTSLASVGRLRSRGVEGDLMIRPTANFNLIGAFAYTEAEITEYPNGPCYPGQTVAQGCRVISSPSGGTASVQDLAGKPLSNVPKFKFNIGGEYTFDEVAGTLRPFVGFNYRWQKAINYSLNQDPATVQPAFGVLDLQAGASFNDDKLKLTAFVNNVFDKHYAAGISNGNFGFFDSTGAAATGRGWFAARDTFRYAGVRLDAKF